MFCTKSIIDAYARHKQLLALLPSVKLFAVALTDAENAHSEDAVVDILNILQHPSASSELFNSNIISLEECQEATACIAETCTEPQSQPWK